MYKYILWDIDGTLIDFKEAEKQAIKMLFEKYNLMECTDEMIEIYSKINVCYWERLERGEMTKAEILIGRFVEFFELMGIDRSIAKKFNEDYLHALGDYIVFVDGALEVLKWQKENYTLIAVTNGTKVAQSKKLKASGLDQIFDWIFISEDIGVEKPRKEFFEYVFRTVGITDAKEALIIGDSLTSDMQGGVNAGIDTCWFNPEGKENNLGLPLTYEIANLEALREIMGIKNHCKHEVKFEYARTSNENC